MVERANRLTKVETKSQPRPKARPKQVRSTNANSQTYCVVEGCEGKIGPTSICLDSDNNLCTSCRRAKSTKKWAERLGEEEFLVDRAVRIAAGKAKARAKSDSQTKKTVCAVEGCGTELSGRSRHYLKGGIKICYGCHQSRYAKWKGNSEEEFLVERARHLATKKAGGKAER